jgi:hypothetical protein
MFFNNYFRTKPNIQTNCIDRLLFCLQFVNCACLQAGNPMSLVEMGCQFLFLRFTRMAKFAIELISTNVGFS